MLSTKVSSDLLYLGAAPGDDLWNIPSNWNIGTLPALDASIVLDKTIYNNDRPLNIKNYTKTTGTIE